VLRPWTLDDREAWYELSTDPRILIHIGKGQPPSDDEIDTRLRIAIDAWDRPGYGLFACEPLEPADDDHAPIGLVGFAEPTFLPELLPVLEIGWRLRPRFWGRGYASEAAAAALTWAFDEDLFSRVVACIQVGNERSVAVADRLGMHPLFRTVIPSHECWADVYELTRAEWEGI
jgi:RimJ/RimL family protein N-acetyltransferase